MDLREPHLIPFKELAIKLATHPEWEEFTKDLIIENMQYQVALGIPEEIYTSLMLPGIPNKAWCLIINALRESKKNYITPEQLVELCIKKKDKSICETVLETARLNTDQKSVVTRMIDSFEL